MSDYRSHLRGRSRGRQHADTPDDPDFRAGRSGRLFTVGTALLTSHTALPHRFRAVSWNARLWALLAVMVLVLSGCRAPTTGETTGPGQRSAAAKVTGFVRADGRRLEIDGEPTRLKAVNFTNRYEFDIKGSELLSSTYHAERDFARVRELGFNSIRFAFKGEWYVQNEEAFWAWLDQNVAWAREYGLRLILDLHIPIGGYWLDPNDGTSDFRLWSDADAQQQNVDLWFDIARRYHDEPAVAAYDLLNEPVTTDATGKQWQELAQEMVEAIRSVDTNHLLVIGGVYGVEGSFDPEGEQRHLLVEDENAMYDFHFYEPYEYTHQYVSWVDPTNDGGRYPDLTRLVPTSEPTILRQNRIATPPLPAGTSEWEQYDSGMVPIREQEAVAASPLIVVEKGMGGTAHFDRITVTEYGRDGTRIREIVHDDVTRTSVSDWHAWGDQGEAAHAEQLTAQSKGYQDDTSLSIGGPVGSGTGWSNSELLFPVVPGNQYRVQGYMRGQDVTAPGGGDSRIHIELELYAEDSDAPGNGFLPRNRDYLEHVMTERLEFGAEHDVPMSVMEFGTVRRTFETDGKGGEQWVTDMLTLLDEHDVSFGYWEYHDPEMGIYVDLSGPPSAPNAALQEVLQRELDKDNS